MHAYVEFFPPSFNLDKYRQTNTFIAFIKIHMQIYKQTSKYQ